MHDRGVFAALTAVGKAWIVEPLWFAQGAAHARPVVLVAGANEDPAVLAGIGAAGRGISPAPPGLDAGPVVGGDGDLGKAVARVRQAHVDALPLARNVALEEGRQRAN